jgi:hypothetical protein
MHLLRSPRNKALAASALLLLLSVAGFTRGLDTATMARWVLAAMALLGLVLWAAMKSRAPVGRFSLPPRLELVARVGLSQRSGVALLEADGRTYLVVHGDGYAEVREAPSAAAAQGRSPSRRPARRPRLQKVGVR